MIVLDTDCLSLLNRERIIEASTFQRKLDEFPIDELFTTIVTFEEQMRGWLSFLARSRNLEEKIFAYEMLHHFLEIFRNTKVLDFDKNAAAEFAKLKAAKIRVGTMDLKIAAIAIANNAILVTRNLVDFEKVPGLNAQDWT